MANAPKYFESDAIPLVQVGKGSESSVLFAEYYRDGRVSRSALSIQEGPPADELLPGMDIHRVKYGLTVPGPRVVMGQLDDHCFLFGGDLAMTMGLTLSEEEQFQLGLAEVSRARTLLAPAEPSPNDAIRLGMQLLSLVDTESEQVLLTSLEDIPPPAGRNAWPRRSRRQLAERIHEPTVAPAGSATKLTFLTWRVLQGEVREYQLLFWSDGAVRGTYEVLARRVGDYVRYYVRH